MCIRDSTHTCTTDATTVTETLSVTITETQTVSTVSTTTATVVSTVTVTETVIASPPVLRKSGTHFTNLIKLKVCCPFSVSDGTCITKDAVLTRRGWNVLCVISLNLSSMVDALLPVCMYRGECLWIMEACNRAT